MGGTIGYDPNDTWKPYTNSDQKKHAKMVQNFEQSMKDNVSERIGVFADKQRPEPLHCEINSWKQVLNIVYQESVQQKMFDQFIKVLGDPPSPSSAAEPVIERHKEQVFGCGLQFLVPSIKAHFDDEKKRFNKIPTRIIGEQVIAIAQYGYRLVDSLEFPDESAVQKVKRLSLSRIMLNLRNAFNKVSSTKPELLELYENCKLYFNLLCLFFPRHINVTSWTVDFYTVK